MCGDDNDGACNLVQQCSSSTCFNSFWITRELFGTEVKIFQALTMQAILGSRVNSLLVLGLFMERVNKKTTNYRQPYPLLFIKTIKHACHKLTLMDGYS